MSAQILLHPRLPQRVPFGDVVRYFESRGYVLSNTRARNIEARPKRTSVVDAMFRFLGAR